MFKRRFKADPNDIVVVVMGPTGSGKTHFINTLTGKQDKHSADKLESHTADVTAYATKRDGCRFVFIDTPGFDDTNRPDSEILMAVSNWLTQKYPDGAVLNVSGIIYFHRITDNRMSGSVYKNLKMFTALCGRIPLRRTRLVTTMWNIASDLGVAEARENQLKCNFWKEMLDGGSEARRFDNTPNCAWDIVCELRDLRKDGEELLLQAELVNQNKRLIETEAGKVLYSRFQQLLAEQEKMLEDLADEARLANDSVRARELLEKRDKISAQLEKTLQEMRRMKAPFITRIRLWLSS